MLLKTIEHFKKSNNLALPHKGIVVDNADPLQLGRIKASIAGIFDEEDTTKLPWITPDNSAGNGGEGSKGNVNIPDVDSELTIVFPTGDIYAPFYKGPWNSTQTFSGEFKQSYPNAVGTKDSAGNTAIHDKETGVSTMQHSSGMETEVDNDGNVKVVTRGTVTLVSEDGLSLFKLDSRTGTVTLLGNEVVDVNGNQVNINSEELNLKVGNVKEEITGSRETSIDGGQKISVGGSQSNNIVGDSAETVLGKTNTLHVQQKSEVFGEGYNAKVALGNFVVECLLGNIDLSTAAGEAKLGNLIGNLSVDIVGNSTLTGLLTTIKALTVASVDAPLITLGKGLAPVITSLSDPIEDYVTGRLKLGVPTILAG